jgi:hypothetical protein
VPPTVWKKNLFAHTLYGVISGLDYGHGIEWNRWRTKGATNQEPPETGKKKGTP